MKRLFACVLLALTSAAFGATLTPVQLLNPVGSTIGQAIVSTGATTAPAWGNVTATSLAPQPANTVMANATGSTASPTAFAMPSCSGANNALRWTSNTGFTCASSIALTSGSLSQFAATTSAQLLGVISDETGTGSLVFGTSPTLTTPSSSGLFHMTNTSAGAQVIELTGNGATTPNKYLGVLNGVFTIFSSSGAVQLFSVDDSGNLAVIGSLKGVNSKVIATNSTSQSIPNSTATAITNWTLQVNQGSNFTASTGVYVTPAAGTYDIRAAITFTPAASVVGAQVILQATINGVAVQDTTFVQQLGGNTFQSSVTGAFRVFCNAGDSITLRILQTSGAAMTLNATAVTNWLSIEQEP